MGAARCNAGRGKDRVESRVGREGKANEGRTAEGLVMSRRSDWISLSSSRSSQRWGWIGSKESAREERA